MDIDGLIIEGSKAVGYEEGLVITEDGKYWFWEDQSYADDSTGFNLVSEGEWKEYKPYKHNDEND